MKKIKFKDIEYTIPTKWEEVTLEKQIQVSEAEKEFTNETFKRIALLSGYAGIPVDVLKKSTTSEVAPLIKELKFLNEDLPKEKVNEFEFKGEKYIVAQSLIDQEFQDFVSIETAFSMYKDSSYKAIPLVLAVLCRKEGETLDNYDLQKRAELFKELPMTIVEPIRVFFYHIGITSSIVTQLSTKDVQEELIKQKIAECKAMLNKQDGGALYTRLLRGMLRKYLKYLELAWEKSSNSTQ